MENEFNDAEILENRIFHIAYVTLAQIAEHIESIAKRKGIDTDQILIPVVHTIRVESKNEGSSSEFGDY